MTTIQQTGRNYHLIILLLFVWIPVSRAAGQSASAITSYQNALTNAINTLLPEQRSLYNGTEYTPSEILSGSHPFFIDTRFQFGRIVYGGLLYDDISLLYDLAKDDVVIENSGGYNLNLVKDNVDEFTIHGHLFRNIRNHTSLPPGFYDILFEGDVLLCARRSKGIKWYRWTQTDAYYLIDQTNIYSLTDKKSVLKALSTQEKQVRNFMEENKLTFGKKREKSLVSIIQYYSTIKN